MNPVSRPTGGPRQRRYTRHEVTAARAGRLRGERKKTRPPQTFSGGPFRLRLNRLLCHLTCADDHAGGRGMLLQPHIRPPPSDKRCNHDHAEGDSHCNIHKDISFTLGRSLHPVGSNRQFVHQRCSTTPPLSAPRIQLDIPPSCHNRYFGTTTAVALAIAFLVVIPEGNLLLLLPLPFQRHFHSPPGVILSDQSEPKDLQSVARHPARNSRRSSQKYRRHCHCLSGCHSRRESASAFASTLPESSPKPSTTATEPVPSHQR